MEVQILFLLLQLFVVLLLVLVVLVQVLVQVLVLKVVPREVMIASIRRLYLRYRRCSVVWRPM